MKLKSLLLLSLFFSFLSLELRAQEVFGLDVTEADPDMDKVEIYLHTVNIGNMVYDNFGHTAIRVVDKRDFTDKVYNWGIFDFGESPTAFAVEFYKGNLNYKLGTYSNTHAMRIYTSDTRMVWEDQLVLSDLEKTRLLNRLAWNRRPENQYYNYQYFFDNCSTRPRDYLDEALGGDLKARYERVLSPMTFRDFVREGYQYTPGFDVLLDFGMNSNLDRNATMWETGFHPVNLRGVLKDYSEKERPLLANSRVIYEHKMPPAYPRLAYSFILLFGGVPLIPLGLWLFFQQDKVRPSKLLFRLFGGLSSIWLGIGGFFGFLMTFSWIFSGHTDLHHNANQLAFWPTDLIVWFLAFMIFVRGRPYDLSPKVYYFYRVYLMAHILVAVSLPVVSLFGLITQDVSRVSIYLLPPYVVILLLMFRVGIRNKDDYRVRGDLEGSR